MHKINSFQTLTAFLFLIIFSIVFLSCTKEEVSTFPVKPENCSSITAELSYRTDISPLIIAYCNGPTCHSAGEGNYDFSRYEGLADRIRSGNLEERLLLSPDNPLYMPKGGMMDVCDLYTLRMWIHAGFKNN